MSELDTWRQLADEVTAGKLTLKLDADGLAHSIQHLQNFIDTIDGLGDSLQVVAHTSGFGDFQIGTQLAQKFTAKGSGDEGIAQRLKELSEEAKTIQDTIRKATKAYIEADQQHATDIASVEGNQ